MSVKIRLMRVGKRKQPSYRVVVADERQARDGRIIETIGNYGPRQDPSHLEIKMIAPLIGCVRALNLLSRYKNFSPFLGFGPSLLRVNQIQ